MWSSIVEEKHRSMAWTINVGRKWATNWLYVCRGLKETAVKSNRYVVNGKLFRTLAHDVGRRTQNSGVCVPTVEGETYYGQLIDIVEVEYYDRTTYVLFKCN
jgi:hypothetical protein